MSSWSPTEPDFDGAFRRFPDPLLALAKGDTPAIILRGAYDASQCPRLIRRFTEMGLMRDPSEESADRRSRIDIGTSLGNRGSDRKRFLHHAATTRLLFRVLFEGFANPVNTIYESLSHLANGKEVKTAREPDGSHYGPAIFRVHYESHTYKPHIDSVRLREKRVDYEVHRFAHQFAGVLCFQNASEKGAGTQALLHRCFWTPEIQPHIERETFHEYTNEHRIENCRVELEPGDLYFFNTRLVHEVPAVQGNQPRIVLAVFIGYSPDDNEIYVWS